MNIIEWVRLNLREIRLQRASDRHLLEDYFDTKRQFEASHEKLKRLSSVLREKVSQRQLNVPKTEIQLFLGCEQGLRNLLREW